MINKQKIVCVDVETTGVDPYSSEALQVSIINGEGTCLFSEYTKPSRVTSWEGAERVNGISPIMVADKPPLMHFKPILDEIFANAALIVGYNSDTFDIPLLRNLGIHIDAGTPTFDVMHAFSPIFGEWNEKYGDYKWQKLTTCARYYGYGEFGAHDALEDTKSTLHCYFAMHEKDPVPTDVEWWGAYES